MNSTPDEGHGEAMPETSDRDLAILDAMSRLIEAHTAAASAALALGEAFGDGHMMCVAVDAHRITTALADSWQRQRSGFLRDLAAKHGGVQ